MTPEQKEKCLFVVDPLTGQPVRFSEDYDLVISVLVVRDSETGELIRWRDAGEGDKPRLAGIAKKGPICRELWLGESTEEMEILKRHALTKAERNV